MDLVLDVDQLSSEDLVWLVNGILLIHPSQHLAVSARRQSIPPAVALLLAGILDQDIELALSQNLSVEASGLRTLADSRHPLVRRYVARHPKTFYETLIFLADDSDDDVRAEVVHRSTPLDQSVIEALASTLTGAARVRLAQRPEIVRALGIRDNLVDDPDDEVRLAIASNTVMTWDLLCRIATDTNPDVRPASGHPQTHLARPCNRPVDSSAS